MKRTDDLFSSILKLLKGRTRVTTKIHETAERDQSRPELVYPMNEYWDYLIVLDACRYDYLKRTYVDYFPEGRLTKRLSPGTWTLEWASRVFTDSYKDCIYISANPMTGHSRNLRHKANLTRFEASKHFYKVIDVWKTGWNDGLKTVHPKAVNEAVFEATQRFPDKKLIIHYVQPHYPYLYLDGKHERRTDIGILSGYVRASLVRMLGSGIGNRLGARLAPNSEEWIAKKIGIAELKMAYENNLRVALTYVKELLPQLKGKVIVTSDHGELLGEKGMFGHPVGLKMSEQCEVPWLEIDNGFSNPISSRSDFLCSESFDAESEKSAKERLRLLGYE